MTWYRININTSDNDKGSKVTVPLHHSPSRELLANEVSKSSWPVHMPSRLCGARDKRLRQITGGGGAPPLTPPNPPPQFHLAVYD